MCAVPLPRVELSRFSVLNGRLSASAPKQVLSSALPHAKGVGQARTVLINAKVPTHVQPGHTGQ